MQGKIEKLIFKTSDSLSPSLHIEINKISSGISVLICEVSGIKEYSQNCVTLCVGRNLISIIGEEINLECYDNHNVEVLGKIKGVELK